MSDLIKRLIASGELVLYHDYRSRSLRDWSGQGNDGVAVNTPKWGGGNIQLADLSLQSIQVATAPEFNMSAFTLLMLSSGFIRPVPAAALIDYHMFFARFPGGASVNLDFAFLMVTSGGNPQFQLGDNTSGKTCNGATPVGKKLIAVSAANNTIASLYTDGIFAGNFLAASNLFNTNNTQPIYIGNYDPAIGAAFVNSRIGIQAALIINRQLTATEHAQIYGELLNMSWESKPGKHAWRNTKPGNVSANTVAQYEMVARGTTVADVSGNGRNGTLTNSPWMAVQTPVGRGFVFSRDRVANVGGYLDTGFGNATLNDTTDDKSCCLWVRSPGLLPVSGMGVLCRASTSQRTHGIRCITTGSVPEFLFTSWNGAADEESSKASLRPNNYHHLGFTFNASTKAVQFLVDGEACGAPVTLTTINQVGAVNWRVGSDGQAMSWTLCFNGACVSPQFIKAVQDATWWKEQYRAGAKSVQYAMGNGLETSLVTSEGGVVGTYLSNSRWRFADATARVKVGIEQINGQYMKTFEGVTAGYLYAPIESMLGNDAPNSSYGTWEWYQYKTDTQEIYMGVTSVGMTYLIQGGYTVQSMSTENIRLVRNNIDFPIPEVAALTHSVWQKIRLTRGYNGRFRLYVDGNLVGSGTDNSYFTTLQFLLYLGVGCKIAGLTKYLGDMSV